MTQEAKRCALALDLARAGKTAAMVCSGDSGIYGMAALLYELRGEAAEPEIEVIPGLTAACSGGALLGAPLTHDFAVPFGMKQPPRGLILLAPVRSARQYTLGQGRFLRVEAIFHVRPFPAVKDETGFVLAHQIAGFQCYLHFRRF